MSDIPVQVVIAAFEEERAADEVLSQLKEAKWAGLIGGLAAKLRDSGFSDERLKTVGASLKPGTSAIIAIIEHKWVAELEQEMAEAGADVLTEAIAADIAGQLETGREVAYTALSTTDGQAVSRVSTGEDFVEASGLAISEDGLIAGNIVATEDAIAGERLVATDEGISYTIGAAVVEDEGPPAEVPDRAEAE